jgi:hypothetical protein
MRRALRAAVVVAAVVAPCAQAGGTQVNVAATAGRVWVTTGYDVVELEASSGRVVRRLRVRFPYPIEIGVSDGNVWVSSVENGFTAGAVTRIPFEPWRRVRSPLVLPARPIYSLAVGSDATWALVGPWNALRLARIDHATRRVTTAPVRHDVGWLAADDTGLTAGVFGVTQRGEVLRAGAPGGMRAFATVPAGSAPPAVGLGSVWVPVGRGLSRVDARTGRRLGRIAVRDRVGDVGVGGRFVWLLTYRPGRAHNAYAVLKVDPTRMRVVARRPLVGTPGGMAFGNGALWIGRSVPAIGVLRVDPRTLRLRVFGLL